MWFNTILEFVHKNTLGLTIEISLKMASLSLVTVTAACNSRHGLVDCQHNEKHLDFEAIKLHFAI